MTSNKRTFDQLIDNYADPIAELINDPFAMDAGSDKMTSLNDQTIAQYTTEDIFDKLPSHRQEQAQSLMKHIDETNPNALLAYGTKAQSQLGDFSRSLIDQIRIKDANEIGQELTQLMNHLESTDPTDLANRGNFMERLLGKAKRSISDMHLNYQKLSAQIDRIAVRLQQEKEELLQNNLVLNEIYQQNKDYYEALNIYIAAAELKMKNLQNETIPALIEQSHSDNDPMIIQQINDLNQFLNRLDKRTHDLRLSRQLTIQQAPQIRMIQDSNQQLAEKIQTSIHMAIPLWENQISIALALDKQQRAASAQQAVSDTTNRLLLKNSEMLKQNAITIAKESERGVIDLETLQNSQSNLVETLKETLAIQQEGRKQRRLAEIEISKMEAELKSSLLSIVKQPTK